MSRKASSLTDRAGVFRPEVLDWAEDQPGTVILESNGADPANTLSYLFSDPVEILTAETNEGVPGVLEMVDLAVQEGAFAAGYLAYEAGYAFEPKLSAAEPGSFPLVWFGIYDSPLVVDRRTGKITGPRKKIRDIIGRMKPQTSGSFIPSFRASISIDHYLESFGRIQRYLTEGDTYQVNLTFKLLAEWHGRTWMLYDRMRRAQRVSYGAFVNSGRYALLSCSPELFFRRQGKRMILKPMKGTISRGKTLEEDEKRRTVLKESEKDRAENLMIVDLLRNDIGKIARPGSVKVRSFFDIERYETVFQATSTIEARLRDGCRIPEIFRALFPSGSVTGAPKIRSMEIIRELEKHPRGIYTGGIGFLGPGNQGVFNVAIRTLAVDRETGRIEFGVGSGIVSDSVGEDEYAECRLKARFLQDGYKDFSLLETILWSRRSGWSMLRMHEKRLRRSASYFGFAYTRKNVETELNRVRTIMMRRKGSHQFKVRLLLDRHGDVKATCEILEPLEGPQFVRLSPFPVDAEDRFLFHKTTNRDLYDRELTLAREEGFFDVIFQNRQGEITEGARSNILVRRGETFLTPPLECGLLAGTYRTHLLATLPHAVREQRLSADDLVAADELFVCNALRGMVKVTLPAQAMTA